MEKQKSSTSTSKARNAEDAKEDAKPGNQDIFFGNKLSLKNDRLSHPYVELFETRNLGFNGCVYYNSYVHVCIYVYLSYSLIMSYTSAKSKSTFKHHYACKSQTNP